MVQEICPTQTRVWLKRGALLVDVRERSESGQVKLDVPDMVNIPFSEMADRFAELPADRELVMVCRDGSKGQEAAALLVSRGYDPGKVVSMKHGILKWAFRGFPLVGDPAVLGELGTYGACHGKKHAELGSAG